MESNLIGPRDHVTWLSLNVRLDGITEVRWAMPDNTKRTTLQMTAGPTLLQRTWDMLDEEVACIKNPHYAHELEYHKYRATAIADVLAIFMVPHFTTQQEISREALRRWQAREDGDTSYETAGLGSRRYEPPAAAILDRAKEQGRSTPAKTKTRAPRAERPTGKRIPEQAVATAKEGISSGMFTVKQIATGYGMTEAEVKAQLGLDNSV